MYAGNSGVGVGMRQNRANPVMVEGEVSITCFVDPITLDQRKRNVQNNVQSVYPGGADDYNLRVNRGEIVMGKKYQEDYSGLPYVYGTSSANGENYEDYGSHDAMENAHYFVGLAKTDFKTNDVDQPEHGFPVYVAGKTTAAANNDGTDKYAGDDVEAGFPPCPMTPGYQGSKIPHQVAGNRLGVPLGKQLYQFRRCDYTDYKMYWAGFHTRLSISRDDTLAQGSAGIKLDECLNLYEPRDPMSKVTNIQEQDAKLKFGLITSMLRGIEYLVDQGKISLQDDVTGRQLAVDLADAMNLYQGNAEDDQSLISGLMAAIAFPELPQSTSRRNAENTFLGGEQQFDDPAKQKVHTDYVNASLHCASFVTQGCNLVGDRKRSKRVGKVLAATPAYESMDILLKH